MWKAFGIGVVRVCSRFSFLYPPFLLEQTVSTVRTFLFCSTALRPCSAQDRRAVFHAHAFPHPNYAQRRFVPPHAVPPLFPDREFPCSHRSSSRPRNRPCAGSRNDLQCRLTWLQGRRAVTVRCSFSGRKTLPHRPLHGSAGVFSWRSLRHSRSGFR